MVLPHHFAAIDSAMTQLADLAGTKPRLIEEPGAVRIDIEVTAAAVDQWPELLAVLNHGSAFGLTETEAGTTAWMRFKDPAEGIEP